jgi:hypothetical protein
MSNDPFKRHGIEHLSPSALNTWRASPGIWALRYLGKLKDDGNAAMWRGTAVENGMAALLRGSKLDAATDIAHQAFDLNAAGEIAEEISEERNLISPMLEQCLRWKPPGDLNASQLKVEHWFDDVSVPVIGYLDFAFDGIDVDLKTTKACPSSPRSDHIRQVALYRVARKRSGGVLYVTGKRHQYFDIDSQSMEMALNDLHADALSLMSFLSRFGSAREAIQSLPMDRSHFMFPTKPIPLDLLMAG